MKEATADRVILHLKKHYYGNVILLALLFLLVLFRVIPFPENILSVGTTLERYAIMITLIAIPAALKLFADRLKKTPRTSEVAETAKKYKKLSYMRLYTLSTVTMMNIVLLGFSRNTNFMWFTVVLFIIFLFCMPSSVELTRLTELPGREQQDMQEHQELPGDE